ncbi:hypothetical protein NA56DRAFT_754277 [Hyaloscypha hepaticicola]|uniref:Fucose-specific lectin n=1 Tax=Hyaloscypha hepaticicola TaxID=2082293 RepID=A0A2J6PMD2_9HELO|nr:hypothetical protein NA56DRAFT_754277 [Hyaloscypha hepaticicola]
MFAESSSLAQLLVCCTQTVQRPLPVSRFVPVDGKQTAFATEKEAVVLHQHKPLSGVATSPRSFARWSGKIRIITGIVALLIIGLIVGLAVGLTKYNPHSNIHPQNNTSTSASASGTSSTSSTTATSTAQGIRSDSSIAAILYSASQAPPTADNIYVFYQDTNGYIKETSRSSSSPDNWAAPIALVKAKAKTPLAAAIWGTFSQRSFFYLDANNVLCEYFWDQVWGPRNITQPPITVHPMSQLAVYLGELYPELPQLLLYQDTSGSLAFLSWNNNSNSWQTGSFGQSLDSLVGTGISITPYETSETAATQLQLFYQKSSMSLSIRTWNTGVWGSNDTNLELIPATVPLASSFYFSGSGNPVINVMYPSILEHVIVDYQVPADGWNTGGEVSVTINTNSSIGLITSQRFYALVGNEIEEYSQQANGSFTLTSIITTNF